MAGWIHPRVLPSQVNPELPHAQLNALGRGPDQADCQPSHVALDLGENVPSETFQ